MRAMFLLALVVVAACARSARSNRPSPEVTNFAAICAEAPQRDKNGVEGCVMKDQRAIIAMPVDTLRRP